RGFKNGAIDQLKIYNRSLTSIEVQAEFKGQPLNDVLQASDPGVVFDYYFATVDALGRELNAELKKLRDEENSLINSIPEIMVMGDRAQPRPTFVLKRGMYDSPLEPVMPGVPASILPMDSELPRNRLGFAKWLVDRGNPLTARVIVNRYWQMFFGKGIVETSDNLGSQGTLPSHPELLDYLAKWFVDSGWNLKALHKLIATSATYRQSSQATPELLAGDPDT